MPEHVYEIGDWVTITGQIKEFHPNTIDLGVEVFSKTDQYTAFVRRDLCAPGTKPLAAQPAEGSVALLNGHMAYQRMNDLGDVEVIHHA